MHTFFDVETPCQSQDRICSIGVIQTDDYGHILFRDSYLVNPECSFSPNNIKIHGITRDQCACQPTFLDLWNSTLHNLFENSYLVAHNAPFDLSVLNKTLQHYDIEMKPVQYLCTLDIWKSNRDDLESYALDKICDAIGLPPFTHHNALADVTACYQIFSAAINNGFNINPKWYDPKSYTNKPRQYTNRPKQDNNMYDVSYDDKRFIVKAVTELYGIIIGIGIDGSISPIEHNVLSKWCADNANIGSNTLDTFISKIQSILSDNFITTDERIDILLELRPFVKSKLYIGTTVAYQELKGILKGIHADGLLSVAEASKLHDWIISHEDYFDDSTTINLMNHIEAALEDGVITQKEQDAIFNEFDNILDPIANQKVDVEFEGKTFCLSGDFVHGSKDEVAEYITEKGGLVASGVSKKVSYVVVGDHGSDQYSYDNYGAKVKKALDMQQQGIDINVIAESELFE